MKIFQYIVVIVTAVLMIWGMVRSNIYILCGFGFLSILNLLLIFLDDFGEMKDIQRDSVKVGIIGHLFKRSDDDVDD